MLPNVGEALRRDAASIVRDTDDEPVVVQFGHDADAAAAGFGADPVNDRIFDDRLQEKDRHRDIIQIRIVTNHELKLLGVHDLVHLQIQPDIPDLVDERAETPGALQILAQQVGKALRGMACLPIVMQLRHSADGFERIEQEMRIICAWSALY